MTSEIKEADAFEVGYNAAIDGLNDSDNPYPVDTADHENWHHGFMAFEEDDPDA